MQPKQPSGWLKLLVWHVLNHEIIKVREWIPHTGPLTKVIRLKLFLDIVLSSSEDITRALRGQPKRLSRTTWEKFAGTSFYMFWFRFIPDMFSALSAAFLCSRAFRLLLCSFGCSLFCRLFGFRELNWANFNGNGNECDGCVSVR